jgi:dihydrofolate reductase
VRRLKERAVPALFVFGSGRLSATLLEGGLFDEVRLGLTPKVIGAGTTLFGRGTVSHQDGIARGEAAQQGVRDPALLSRSGREVSAPSFGFVP